MRVRETYAGLRFPSLLQHENSNIIALKAATKGKRWYALCMEAAVAYYRVSARQQQRSGLWIEARRATVKRFAEAEQLTIIAEFVEAAAGRALTPSTAGRNSQPPSPRPRP